MLVSDDRPTSADSDKHDVQVFLVEQCDMELSCLHKASELLNDHRYIPLVLADGIGSEVSSSSSH